ncbi:period circadian protein homolog 1-like [Rhipicephalus sanguineus]|uniref:period circadian protein homolog 1-like n=1 Tax=Rhipicephalus sanguineus TaxID=34632 RepID=UPI0020C487E0|nr:period circadian protein homolog 1-like [Rhipicephalus sanguineus]
MYVGGVPLYPSLPTGDGPQSKGMWQCGALPLMPLWQQPPVNRGTASGQEATKADAKTPGAPTGAATEKHSDDALRKPLQEGTDKTSGPATITGLGDGYANGRRGSGGANGGTEMEGCSMRPFKPYSTGFGSGPTAGSAKSDADDRRHSQSTEKDMHQDAPCRSPFESSFFEKSENSESQFSSEKSSEDTDSEMKDRRRKQPSRAVLREPHWTEGVSLTAELVYRYQMRATDAADVLRGDRDKLQRMQQPRLVNEQLSVLQLELEDALDGEPAAEDEPMRGGAKARSPSAGLGSSKSATLPDATAEAAETRACAMYAMEEDDLTQEMAAKEERLLSSYDPDFALADSDAEF